MTTTLVAIPMYWRAAYTTHIWNGFQKKITASVLYGRIPNSFVCVYSQFNLRQAIIRMCQCLPIDKKHTVLFPR